MVSESKRKTRAFTIVLTTLGFCAIALTGINHMSQRQQNSFNWGESKTPSLLTKYSVPQSSRDDLFRVLEEFSGNQGFQFGRSRIHPQLEQYGISIRRKDIAIEAFNVTDVESFEFAVYIDPDNGGSNALAQSVFDALAQRLMSIPGVVAVRESPPIPPQK